ncbi:snaclec A11-like [Aplysia californica]|uniref:Snaclec A11-like n=1 Tax=Aplysia californica TaxID=6500 RepID=A0ABM0JPN5_APLCA|nr:snaclec A11-like [Aplysia californica]
MLSFSSALVVFLVLGLGNTKSIDDCPSGIPRNKFLQFRKGLCYEFAVTTYRYFWHAESNCLANGGLLVQIKSKDINDYIQKELHETYKEPYDTWIGLDDANPGEKFTWADGSSVNYENWAPNEGERFGGGLDACATIDPVNGTWIDYPCQGFLFEEVKPYVCEYDPDNLLTTPATN